MVDARVGQLESVTVVRRPVALGLALLFVLGAAACGGGGGGGGEEGGGGADQGKQVFEAQGCGGCHAFAAAGSSGTTGPDLDESLAGEDAESVREDVVDPNAEIEEGFQPNVMPQDYDEKLSDGELDALVAFLVEQRSG